MRTTAILVAILLLGGASVILWQRSQIAVLRGQVNAQGVALAGDRERLDELSVQIGQSGEQPGLARAAAQRASWVRPADYGAATRADERRVILAQYRDVLSQANLPEEAASRLQNLLADRVEAFLDAQDAARREGFAEGSAAMERAVALAIGEDDRLIGELLAGAGDRRIDRSGAPLPAEPPLEPAPAAPIVVVNVVSQAPYQAPAPDQSAPLPSDYPAAGYAPFYYPPMGFAVVGDLNRPFIGSRLSPSGPHRYSAGPRLRRG
jgi:hypothetical protein